LNKKEYDSLYRKEHYRKLGIDLPKETVEKFKSKCAEKGKTMAEVIKAAIDKFIQE